MNAIAVHPASASIFSKLVVRQHRAHRHVLGLAFASLTLVAAAALSIV